MNKWRAFICVSLSLFPFIALANGVITDFTAVNIPGATRLQFSLDQDIPHRIFALSKPDRLVIDFKENAKLKASLSGIQAANSDIKTIRGGHPKPDILRVVIEMRGALLSYKVVPSKSSQLIIDMKSPSLARAKATPAKELIADLPKLTTPAGAEPVVAKTLMEDNYAPTPENRQIVVVIDPGHGGKDPGAIGIKGTKEKDVVLGIGIELAKLINNQTGMKAVLTRKDDSFVPLRNRLRLARKGKADLFIAIHADSYFNKHSSGVSVYALSQRGATSEAARWLARRDNDSELGGVDLSELQDQSYLLRSVLIDLAQTATITDSLRLGGSMLKALYSITSLHYHKVEQAPFVVLKSPDIPSILVETGFISNAREELRLRDKNYQSKIAAALFKGVNQYTKKYYVANR